MRQKLLIFAAACGLGVGCLPHAFAGFAGQPAAHPQSQPQAVVDPVKILVNRLEVERYKATIKGLTQFGDRRQGTDRNRQAIDWIETQLKSYGCANIERLQYDYQPPVPDLRTTGPNTAGGPGTPTPAGATSVGGGIPRGLRVRTGVNNDPNAQPDLKLRALDTPPSVPGAREEVYCTKIGITHPDEMYIVGAHMDGIGWGEAANDDGSGTALVMEIARILSSPDVQTDRSIRFIFWNNEETGLNGAPPTSSSAKICKARKIRRARASYPGAEMAGHDPARYDAVRSRDAARGRHGKQGATPGSGLNIEFQVNSKFAAQSQALAWAARASR